MDNSYTITDIDSATNKVEVTLVYNGSVLDDSFFVEDVTDASEITTGVQTRYQKFQDDLATAAANTPALPTDVISLIGTVTEVK